MFLKNYLKSNYYLIVIFLLKYDIILIGEFMKNKIIFIIFLFFICINVRALTCEYKVDKNKIGLIITVTATDKYPSVQLSGGVYISPGTTNQIGTLSSLNNNSACPQKVYYACNMNTHFCKLNSYYFTDNNATLYGVLELRTNGSSTGTGTATVGSVISDFKNGNSCGALTGLNDLIETYVKMPLIVVALVIFLVMTTLEYAKVVTSEDGSPKKANERTLKRALAMVILGLSPMIIQLLIRLAQIPMSC